MSEATVSAAFARGLLELASSKGISRRTLAERARIDMAQLRDPDNRIPFAKYVDLMRAAQKLCRDPALALHFGESPYAETGIACLVGEFAETGADAFALVNRYARLNVEVDCSGGGDRFVLTRGAGRLWFEDTRTTPNDFPELTELTFACMVCTSRRHYAENHFLKALHFTHAEPAYRAEYDRIFRVPVVFGSDRNALLLTDDAWMTQKMPSSSRLVLDVLSARAEVLLESLENAKSARGRVESVLMPILHSGDVSIGAVAGKLGISRQTLFRRLRAEGTSFERVLDELRHKLALHYLCAKKISVNETADLVGFSDRAAFSRAFKRWTGSSPRRMLAPKFGNGRTGSPEPPPTKLRARP